MADSDQNERKPASGETICPDCKGRGLYRPPGEWTSETCPTCDGRGVIDRAAAARAADG